MPTNTPNLTKSSFRIYISDPQRLLEDIFWETVNGVSKRGEPIRTSNGINKYFIPTRPEIQPVELSKAANPDEDKIIVSWVDSFCSNTPIIEGSTTGGAMLFIVPLKTCVQNEFYNVSAKAYNIVPVGYSGWDADLINNTDTSRFTLTVLPTEVSIN